MKEQSISIIIPVYNRADSVRESIMSVLSQTYRDIEVIVVDDASTDDTVSVVSSIEDDRLRLVRLDENGGVSRARNIGVENARYDLIAFNDSDDKWRPDKLFRQMTYWIDHPECVIVYTAYELCATDEYPALKVPRESYDRDVLSGDIFYCLLQANYIGAPTILLRKKDYLDVGGFDPAFSALEDWDFVLKISRLGPVGYIDEILVDAARSSGGISSSVANYYDARCMLLARYKENLDRAGLFDQVAGYILSQAEIEQQLEPVKKMMMFYLTLQADG